MREIPLTQGKVAIVDDKDYAELSKYKWYAKRKGRIWYVARYVGKRPHRKYMYMHRQILNPPPGLQCDHINSNGLDNRRCNLRLCTNSQNSMNQRSRDGTSEFKGVHWHKRKKKWEAEIMHNEKHFHVGSFVNEEDAARAYDAAAREHFGEFAWLNFPDPKKDTNKVSAVT